MYLKRVSNIFGVIKSTLLRPLARSAARGAFALAIASQAIPYDKAPVEINIPTLAELAISLPEAIKEVKRLSQEIRDTYPPQNLRYIRPLLNNLLASAKDKASPQKIQGIDEGLYNALMAKKKEILPFIRAIKILDDAKYDLTAEAKNDFQAIRSAKTLLDIIRYFSPKKPQVVTITPPGNLPPYQITITPGNDAFSVFQRIDASPKVKTATESTSIAEKDINKGGLATEVVTTLYEGKKPPPGQRVFEFYIDTYGIDRGKSLPGWDKLRALAGKTEWKVSNPNRLWIGDYTVKVTGENSMSLNATYADRYIDLDMHLPIFQFIKTHEQAYKDAAELLHSSHRDISPETLITFLMLNTVHELFWMGSEDAWQDNSAASSYGTKEAASYAKNYSYYKQEKGYAFGVMIEGKAYDIPWRIASTKVPVTSQGLGPNAVIIGDFLKAGEYKNGELWQKYFPGIERNEENAVKIALDPVDSVKAVALVYDEKISKLNNTIFSNPNVRMPDDAYPYFEDPKDARAYFKLSWVRYIKAFPEVANNFPDYFPYGHNPWNIDFLGSYFKVAQIALGLPESLPTLRMELVPNKGKPGQDYFGDNKDPMITDTLRILLVPGGR